MPVPLLLPNGLLPPGIHLATVDEILAAFPPVTARRQMLNDEFIKFMQTAQKLAIIREIVIDGSSITNKQEPDDIDLAAWTPNIRDDQAEALFLAEGVDVHQLIHPWFEEDKMKYDEWVDFFSTTLSGTPKGVIRMP